MVEFEKTCAKLHIRLATLKISSKKQRKSAQEGIYTNLHAEPSILCKARDCNLTLSLCDVPLLSQGEGCFGNAETG
jgi:hypothetical protein